MTAAVARYGGLRWRNRMLYAAKIDSTMEAHVCNARIRVDNLRRRSLTFIECTRHGQLGAPSEANVRDTTRQAGGTADLHTNQPLQGPSPTAQRQKHPAPCIPFRLFADVSLLRTRLLSRMTLGPTATISDHGQEAQKPKIVFMDLS